MRQLLLAAALVGATFQANAQCTPDPLYADSVFGVWPDTLTDFIPGELGVFYSDTLNLIVPLNTTDIDPNLTPAMLDSVQLINVIGLPPGLGVNCNSQTPASCTFLPTMLGCGLIEGTPTQVGNYPIILEVKGWVAVLGFPISQNISFPGYSIQITNNVGIAEQQVAGLSEVRNVPNPFSGRTSIEFVMNTTEKVTLRVYNLVGEQLHEQFQQGRAGANRIAFDGSALSDGIYLYKLSAGNETFTGRMVLHR